MSRKNWTPQEIKTMREMRTRNVPIKEIAEKINRTPASVNIRCSMYKIYAPKQADRYDDEMIYQVKLLLLDKCNTAAIVCRELNIDYDHFTHWLQANGQSWSVLRREANNQKTLGTLSKPKRQDLTPCMLPLKKWPVCREKRCHLHKKCAAFSAAKKLGKVS
jgi:hypothetical protein